MHFDLEIDAIGLKCPMPILKCKKGLNSIQVTQILKISTTDINAKKDFEFFCHQTGHKLISSDTHDSVTTFFIQKI
jgi:tRNA 2-thiouridine synthesizing protein A